MNFDETRVAAEGLLYCVPWMRLAGQKIENLELQLDQAKRHRDGRGTALHKEREETLRLSSLLLEGIRILEKSHEERGLCPDSEHEWINKVLNRNVTPVNRGVKP